MSKNNPYNLKVGDKVNWCGEAYPGPNIGDMGYPDEYVCKDHKQSCYEVHTITSISKLCCIDVNYRFTDFEGKLRTGQGWDVRWFRPAQPIHVTKPRNRLDLCFDE